MVWSEQQDNATLPLRWGKVGSVMARRGQVRHGMGRT